jgi:hypothetical protein
LIQLRATLAKAIDQAGSDDSGLRNMARAFFDFSVYSPEFLDLIMIYESRYFDYINGNGSAARDSYRTQCQQVSADMARMVTTAIEKGMELGTIGKNLAPQQLMLLLWGQIFGVMKIFRMRRQHFEAAFGIRREVLFDHFVAMVERALR